MATVELAATAVANLEHLAVTHSLPADTWNRVWVSIEPLQRFPELGALLGGAWTGARFILGPWRWMVIGYRYDPTPDVVQVLSIEDGRSSRFA